MAEEHIVTGDGIHNGSELEPLLARQQLTYLNFRFGREQTDTDKCAGIVLAVFKFCFCSLGLWGHQAWNYIPRVLLGAVCIFQVFFVLYGDLFNKCTNANFSNFTDTKKRAMLNNRYMDDIDITIFSLASVFSYLVFIGCFMAAKRKDSVMVAPSQALMKDIARKDIFWLFFAFVLFTLFFLSSVSLFYILLIDNPVDAGPAEGSFCKRLVASGVATQLLLHWVSLNTCHIFAVSCLALGTFAQDTLRLIWDVQSGALDDVIRIHEDLCTVVFNTVSAYSVWFVLHWFSYGAGVLLAVMYLSAQLEVIELFKHKHQTLTLNLGYWAFLFLCLLYLFLLPCVYAARITGHCAGIYEKINCTTSADWNESHPFRKDRRNIALFISYAKDRHCGFKVGRITFNTSLAWLSFFLGLTALVYHFYPR